MNEKKRSNFVVALAFVGGIISTSAVFIYFLVSLSSNGTTNGTQHTATDTVRVPPATDTVRVPPASDTVRVPPASDTVRVPLNVLSNYYPSGWMGDGEYGEKYIQMILASRENPHTDPLGIKVVYKSGPARWGGIYWQNKPNNWGGVPGEDLSQAGYKKLTFWARGETGGEVVEFKAGGIRAPGRNFEDSFEITTGRIVLGQEWKQYTLNLEGKDLSNVIGTFAWVTTLASNPKGITFYLDDVFYR